MYLLRQIFLRAWACMAITGLVAEAVISVAFAASAPEARAEPGLVESTVSEPAASEAVAKP